jgi:hypothetical protein
LTTDARTHGGYYLLQPAACQRIVEQRRRDLRCASHPSLYFPSLYSLKRVEPPRRQERQGKQDKKKALAKPPMPAVTAVSIFSASSMPANRRK